MADLIDIFLHVDRHLLELVANYGVWIYGILFLIVFAETGLVVTPFLPGDSLLFAAGALAATGALNLWLVALLLLAAAISGDAVNYAVGRSVGLRVIELARTDPRWGRVINPAYIARAHEFFERRGGKAVVLARFVPIVRTFVPFLAGVSGMHYPKFMLYNVVGSVAWIGLLVYAGYLFGNVRWVKQNLSLIVIAIVVVSLVPAVTTYFRERRSHKPPTR